MNRFLIIRATAVLCLVLHASSAIASQESQLLGPPTPMDWPAIQATSLVDTSITLPVVEFRGTPLRDALDAICRPQGVDIWVDPQISGSVTIRLTDISLQDVLLFFAENYDLSLEMVHGVIRAHPVEPEPPPPLMVSFENNSLQINAAQTPLEDLARAVTEQTGHNLLVGSGTSGTVTGHLSGAVFEPGLRALLQSNGFDLESRDGIYMIVTPPKDSPLSGAWSSSSIRCVDGQVSFAVVDASLRKLIEQIASSCGLQLFIYGTIEGTVSAVCAGIPAEAAFANILNGTAYTYKVEDGVYFVGDKSIDEIATSRLILFDHVVAKDLIDLVPAKLSQHVTVKSVVEQNGIMVSGPYGIVREIERYLKPLDLEPAQVLIEALVVDYSTTETSEFRLTAGLLGAGDSLSGKESYYPSLELERTGPELQKGVDEWASHLGITNIGRLSDDFFIQLRALEQEGIANIRSRPQIAALNGHKASIHVGTTQYYLLESQTVYASGQPTVSTQVSQRFETIDADISFEVTPWVMATGEIVVDIRPEFKTPQGAFDPDRPPTINRRLLESTVRLRDSETIVLGGLIQNGKTQDISKFPILGDIPILGRVFQNRRTVNVKSELVIYLTPHVYRGPKGSVEQSQLEEP